MSKSNAYTLRMDERMETVLESLRVTFGLSTRADVFRMGVGVLRELEKRRKSDSEADITLGIVKDNELVGTLLLMS